MSEEIPTNPVVDSGNAPVPANPLLEKLRSNQGPSRYSSPRIEMGQTGGVSPAEGQETKGYAPRPQADSRKATYGNRPQGGRSDRGQGGPKQGGARTEGNQKPFTGGALRLGDVPENFGAPPAPKPTPAKAVDLKIDPLDAEMEAELQAAFGGIEESLDTFKTERPVREAATPGKKGVVFRIHNGDVFVELPGGRTQGILTKDQFPEGLPEIGTELEIKIERFDNANGLLVLSRLGKAVGDADWSSLSLGMVVEAKVTGVKASGLEVMVNSCRGWLPASQVDLNRTFDLSLFADQKLTCEVIEVDALDKNLIVSRRVLLERQREIEGAKLWGDLAVDQIRKGTVRSIQSFGAFVDIGGADALLPISQISWKRITNIADVLHPGQSVEVKILTLDPETKKISVGLKQLVSSPWQTLSERFRPGTIVTGKVSRTEEFGAFVELEPEIEGLVHISELAKGKVRRTTEVVKTGDEVKVMILTIEPESRRVSLSIKAAIEEADPVEVEEVISPPVPVKPSKPRTTPLRGGNGNWLPLIPPIG